MRFLLTLAAVALLTASCAVDVSDITRIPGETSSAPGTVVPGLDGVPASECPSSLTDEGADLLDETRRVSTQHERWAEELYSAPTAATGAVSKRANVWGREFAKAKGRVGPAMRVSGVVQGPARVEGGEKWAQEYLAEEVPASATTHEVKELQDVADSLFGGLILNKSLSIFLSWALMA